MGHFSYHSTDVMHEVRCRECPTVFHCTCGDQGYHENVASLNLCYPCICKKPAKKYHDPAYDPDDDADQRAYDGFNRFGR